MHIYGQILKKILLFYVFHQKMPWEEGIAIAWWEITVQHRDGPVGKRLELWAFAPRTLFLVIP